MVEKEQEINTSGLKRSSYSDFITEAERLVKLKEGFEAEVKNANLFIEESREDIISQARIMMSEMNYLLTEEETASLEDIVERIARRSAAIRSIHSFTSTSVIGGSDAIVQSEVDEMKRWIYKFLTTWNKCGDNHKAWGLQTTTSKGEIDELYRAYGVHQAFRNSYGVLISPQMEAFCRWAYCRAKENRDNVIIVDGKQGEGKSSFTYGAFTTLAGMFGQKIDLATYNALIFKESREYCQNLIKVSPRFSQMWYDESGNQFNKRSWWVGEQSDLINDLALARESGFTLWLLWGDLKLLDSDLRNYRATALVSIKERGLAVVRQFNQNSDASSSTGENAKIKSKIITSQHEAHKVLESNTLTRMVIPFFDPELKKPKDEQWQIYRDRKTGARKVEISIFTDNKKKKAEELYLDFLLSLDREFVAPGNRIGTALLQRYAESANHYMGMQQLASRIAKATGTTINKIFVRDDPTDASKGYVTIDPIIAAYINRLKAEAEGAKEQKKEMEANEA